MAHEAPNINARAMQLYTYSLAPSRARAADSKTTGMPLERPRGLDVSCLGSLLLALIPASWRDNE